MCSHTNGVGISGSTSIVSHEKGSQVTIETGSARRYRSTCARGRACAREVRPVLVRAGAPWARGARGKDGVAAPARQRQRWRVNLQLAAAADERAHPSLRCLSSFSALCQQVREGRLEGGHAERTLVGCGSKPLVDECQRARGVCCDRRTSCLEGRTGTVLSW